MKNKDNYIGGTENDRFGRTVDAFHKIEFLTIMLTLLIKTVHDCGALIGLNFQPLIDLLIGLSLKILMYLLTVLDSQSLIGLL